MSVGTPEQKKLNRWQRNSARLIQRTAEECNYTISGENKGFYILSSAYHTLDYLVTLNMSSGFFEVSVSDHNWVIDEDNPDGGQWEMVWTRAIASLRNSIDVVLFIQVISNLMEIRAKRRDS